VDALSRQKRIVSAIAVGLGGLFLLSGCGQYAPLPDEERYQYINQVKDDLDYEDSGKVLKSEYDKGDGVFSPSVFYAEIQGSETYSTLSNELQNLPEVKCDAASAEQTRCSIGQADVTITKLDGLDNIVALRILDSFSGRNPNK
jgi:hypothetical protein